MTDAAILIHNEAGVKSRVKKILKRLGVFYYMPAANGFGVTGVPDFVAIIGGRFVGIETKFGSNTMTPNQERFKMLSIEAGALHYLVSEKNLQKFEVGIEKYVADNR